jgi:radical SAM protein with 4Fe4S-binding SPASM domain
LFPDRVEESMSKSPRRTLPIIKDAVKAGERVAKRGLRLAKTYIEHSVSKEWFTPLEIPKLSIETTNVCNAKCVFCANPLMERRKQMLDMEVFKKAVDEAVALGITDLNFNVTIGDPLLDKRLLERARIVRKHPQFETLGFVSTLQWLHLFDIDEFFDAGFTWLMLSITLSGREKYKEFFGVDCYDQMLRNLETLIQENKRRGNPMWIGMSIKPTNEELSAVTGHPDFIRIDAMLDGVNLADRAEQIGLYFDDWGGAVQLPPHLKKRPIIPRMFRPCRFLYTGLMIYSNGNVGACNCRDYEADSDLILGNVKTDSLGDMWHGEQLQSLRDGWRRRNKVPNICSTCRHYVY